MWLVLLIDEHFQVTRGASAAMEMDNWDADHKKTSADAQISGLNYRDTLLTVTI